MVRSLVVGGVYVALVLVVEACSFVVAALLVVFWWSAPSSLGVFLAGFSWCGWVSFHLKFVVADPW